MKMCPVVHFELPYENCDRMVKFYEDVFGWQTRRLGPEMGNYVVVTTTQDDVKADIPRGAIGGGFFPKNPNGHGDRLTIVIAVEDIAATMRAITAGGGTVLAEPVDIPGIGRYVAILDSEKNRVSVLQPTRP